MGKPMESKQEFTVTNGPDVSIEMFIRSFYIAIAVGKEVGIWIQQLEDYELHDSKRQDQKGVDLIFGVQISNKALLAGHLL